MADRKPCPHCGGSSCCGGGGGISFTPYEDISPTKIPHKCPICRVSGKLFFMDDEKRTPSANGYYKICYTCLGLGIVWAPDEKE